MCINIVQTENEKKEENRHRIFLFHSKDVLYQHGCPFTGTKIANELLN